MNSNTFPKLRPQTCVSLSQAAQRFRDADMARQRPQITPQRRQEVIAAMRESLEEQQVAERKEMEEKKSEILQLYKEMEELEQTISKQESVIRRLCAEKEKLEKEASVDTREKLLYHNLKTWIKTMFDRVTAGPYQERFSKFKDPMKQMEVIQDFFRLVRDENTDKAETNPQED